MDKGGTKAERGYPGPSGVNRSKHVPVTKYTTT